MALEIEVLPVLSDNFVFFGRDTETDQVFLVDASEAPPILDFLKKKNWKLSALINTHHHWDHTDGNLEIQKETGCEIWGNANDSDRIPGITRKIKDGERVSFGNLSFQVKEVTGHTRGHIVLWFDQQEVLFTGDTLFSLGCGRLYEGNADQMWSALSWIRTLPPETKVYFGHEYTEKNGEFAKTLEPGNQELHQYLNEVRQKKEKIGWSVPSTIKTENACNPFFRPHSPEIRSSLGFDSETSDLSVFTRIRELRNQL